MQQEEARLLAWINGIPVASWYLRDSQLEAYEFFAKNKRPFFEAARRWGKTTSILIYVRDMLIFNPGWIARICLPEKEQARKIWQPEMDKIQIDCPEELKFKYHTIDSYYEHANGSRIYLHGVNDDRGNSARGSAAHIIVADEFGFWRYPGVVKTVLSPQLRTTNGQFILASTPPEDLAHEYYSEKDTAIRDQRFLQKTIYDDETLSVNSLQQILKDCGAPDFSQADATEFIRTKARLNYPAFLREYLCEPVSDPARLVVPEYDESIHVVDDSYVRPDFFDCYVGADLGFHDFTALLFSYYDFEKATLVIEDELVVKGKNSKEIVDAAKAIEKKLWGTKAPRVRVSDNEIQQLYDMQSLCDYTMVPTRKDDKLAAINGLRLRFRGAKGGIRIKRRCANLRNQLKVGLWNEQRTNYLRSEKGGHLDAIDALVYLNRHINENINPYPEFLGMDRNETYTPKHRPLYDKDDENLKNALDIIGKIGRPV